ncbi:hypothetical protein [Paenibacillus sp. HJGM_3]|uniref:hypothetical protein n=1 Tax=Paenibacillus sp. HJGM_3 TaxID=3379816 RepID=UPI00385937EB
MKTFAVLGVTVVAVFMILFEWPKLKRDQKKEKAAMICLAAIGWLLAVLLVFFPEMPGPTQLFDTIFKPLGKKLE